MFERMIDGEATAEEVASDYGKNVLAHGLDRIVKLEKDAYKIALPQGDIAVVPYSMRGDPAIAGALFTFMCRSQVLDDSVPGMLIPMPYQLSNRSCSMQ